MRRPKKSARRVWTFFYGSFMNPAVLARAAVRPTDAQRGRLEGWDIDIRPRATLAPAKGRRVYGVLARVAHAELDKLYARDWFGFGRYLPEAVIVRDRQGKRVPALCYIAWRGKGGKPTREYLEKMTAVAARLSFPQSYVRRIRSFGQ